MGNYFNNFSSYLSFKITWKQAGNIHYNEKVCVLR
jgi:hypothetical protein